MPCEALVQVNSIKACYLNLASCFELLKIILAALGRFHFLIIHSEALFRLAKSFVGVVNMKLRF